MDFAAYDRITWAGLMGSAPYPAGSTGADLSQNRVQLLAKYGISY